MKLTSCAFDASIGIPASAGFQTLRHLGFVEQTVIIFPDAPFFVPDAWGMARRALRMQNYNVTVMAARSGPFSQATAAPIPLSGATNPNVTRAQGAA
jgi:hypothetical protein